MKSDFEERSSRLQNNAEIKVNIIYYVRCKLEKYKRKTIKK